MVCGGCALLCRELVRRWRAGVISLLLLGLALSVAEEFLIQQTSLAPLPFPGINAAYGRYLGVNWVYFLFMLGYESVWVVLVPVPGDGASVSIPPGAALASQTRTDRHLRRVPDRLPNCVVRMDAAGSQRSVLAFRRITRRSRPLQQGSQQSRC